MPDNENVLDFMDEIGNTPVFDERKAKLQRLFRLRQQFTYFYDFGDGWRHIVEVEAIETQAEPMYSVAVLDGKRAGLLKNVGGPVGYDAFLDTLFNRRDSDEGFECLEWVGGEFDPQVFDRPAANNTLARLALNG